MEALRGGDAKVVAKLAEGREVADLGDVEDGNGVSYLESGPEPKIDSIRWSRNRI